MMKFAGFSLAPDFKMKSEKMFGKAQNAIDQKCIDLMEEYTPVSMESGYTKASPHKRVTFRGRGKMSQAHKQERPGVIVNTEPRARREYYTNKGFSGGKRGKYWFERMKLDRRGEILNAAKDEIK